MAELEKIFNIEGINKSPAIFDGEKLKWMNGVYLRALPVEKFHELALPYYKEAVKRDVDLAVLSQFVQPRVNVLNEIPEAVDFIDELPEYDIEMYVHKKMKTTPEIALKALEEAKAVIAGMADADFASIESVHNVLLAVPERLGMKNGQFLWPVRTALTGKQCTPVGAVEAVYLFGRDESLRRVEKGIEKLKSAIG